MLSEFQKVQIKEVVDEVKCKLELSDEEEREYLCKLIFQLYQDYTNN